MECSYQELSGLTIELSCDRNILPLEFYWWRCQAAAYVEAGRVSRHMLFVPNKLGMALSAG
jgi:hypothetical protein